MERQNDRRKNNFDRKNDRSPQKPGRRPEKNGYADRGAERSFEKPKREERPDWQEESMQNLVYGKNAVTELLKNGAGTDTVFLAEGLAPSVAAYYTALAKEAGAAVKRVHTAKLKSLTGTESHQGVAAFASAVEYASLVRRNSILEYRRNNSASIILLVMKHCCYCRCKILQNT